MMVEGMAWSSPGSDAEMSPTPSLSSSPSPSPILALMAAKPSRSESVAILQRYVEEETEPCDFLGTVQRGEIKPQVRADLFGWLFALNEHFHFDSEVFSLTTLLVDTLLARVKVQVRHLQIIGVTAFLIASKMQDESDEGHPTLRELVANSGRAFGESDIKRMEKIILEKLDWEVRRVTPLMILEELYNIMDRDAILRAKQRPRRLVVIPEDGEPEFEEAPDLSAILAAATHKLQLCSFSYDIACSVRPVTLALAVLGLVIEDFFGSAAGKREHTHTLSLTQTHTNSHSYAFFLPFSTCGDGGPHGGRQCCVWRAAGGHVACVPCAAVAGAHPLQGRPALVRVRIAPEAHPQDEHGTDCAGEGPLPRARRKGNGKKEER